MKIYNIFFSHRFEETNDAGGSCKAGQQCIGGISRLHHQIMMLKNETPDSILLNGGDSFQGTIWYSTGKWNVTQEFMNTLPIDAEVSIFHRMGIGTVTTFT